METSRSFLPRLVQAADHLCGMKIQRLQFTCSPQVVLPLQSSKFLQVPTMQDV